MLSNVVLKFGDKYITKKVNMTWEEAKEFYGKKFISLKERGEDGKERA